MVPKISFFPGKADPDPVFSILIPSWNNLPYLQGCVESIRKNSRHKHQVIVHVNEGSDGTLQWVREQGIAHTYSEGNVGVCYGFNAAFGLATAPLIAISDDDYYYAPDWDYYLHEDARARRDIYFCVTGTIIEHSASKYDSIISNRNFGKTVQEFDEGRFLKEFQSIPFDDWNGGNWYPMVLHRDLWSLVGGLSTEFTPGMGSDPDMMMKLWHCGVRYYKGVSKSRVYHFGSRTTARVVRNDGNRQFLIKWGLSKSTFFENYLRLGTRFEGLLPEPDVGEFRIKLIRDKIKRLASVWV